jgi:hypothetical protein
MYVAPERTHYHLVQLLQHRFLNACSKSPGGSSHACVRELPLLTHNLPTSVPLPVFSIVGFSHQERIPSTWVRRTIADLQTSPMTINRTSGGRGIT